MINNGKLKNINFFLGKGILLIKKKYQIVSNSSYKRIMNYLHKNKILKIKTKIRK